MNSLIAVAILKIVFLSLIVLSLVIVNIFLAKKSINSNYKYVINGTILIIVAILTNQFYSVIEGIFTLKYLSVKLYIVVLIVTNIITIITLQKKIKLVYKIINYLLFIVMSTILVINIMIVTATKLNLAQATGLQDVISLINVSTIVLMIYLTIMSIVYIILSLKNDKVEEPREVVEKKKEKVLLKSKVKKTSKALRFNKKPKKELSILDKKLKGQKEVILTDEELLAYENKKDFSINGVNASIIFEDSVSENIIKNYHLLLQDINSKLVNGYTLAENELLKGICIKLETNDLNQVDVNNLSILNKISIEEYNLLKRLFQE